MLLELLRLLLAKLRDALRRHEYGLRLRTHDVRPSVLVPQAFAHKGGEAGLTINGERRRFAGAHSIDGALRRMPPRPLVGSTLRAEPRLVNKNQLKGKLAEDIATELQTETCQFAVNELNDGRV